MSGQNPASPQRGFTSEASPIVRPAAARGGQAQQHIMQDKLELLRQSLDEESVRSVRACLSAWCKCWPTQGKTAACRSRPFCLSSMQR